MRWVTEQYIGNTSVHWSVTHEDDKGQALKLAARTGSDRRIRPRPTTSTWTNGARGRDPVSPPDVGKRKGHSGHFRVRLRFERMKDARDAAAAAQNVMLEDGMYVLVLDVPVIARAAADDPPPSEVRVDW